MLVDNVISLSDILICNILTYICTNIRTYCQDTSYTILSISLIWSQYLFSPIVSRWADGGKKFVQAVSEKP